MEEEKEWLSMLPGSEDMVVEVMRGELGGGDGWWKRERIERHFARSIC